MDELKTFYECYKCKGYSEERTRQAIVVSDTNEYGGGSLHGICKVCFATAVKVPRPSVPAPRPPRPTLLPPMVLVNDDVRGDEV